MPTHVLCGSIVLVFAALFAFSAEQGADLLTQAQAALAQKRPEEALTLTTKAIAADPRNARAYFLRGATYAILQKHAEAIADFDKTISLDPRAAEAYNHRGGEHFKLGRIQESLADFDKFLELRPTERPGHWQRGISLYYAGRFDEGRKQFEGYEQVDTNDVENAVWHFLCTARLVGIEKARQSLLKIGNDRRVPMMQVYSLFAGKLQPDDILAAANAGKPSPEVLNLQLFYAHLYLGLYYEILGDSKRTLEHLTKADEHKVTGYMWDVAHVHRERVEKELQGKK